MSEETAGHKNRRETGGKGVLPAILATSIDIILATSIDILGRSGRDARSRTPVESWGRSEGHWQPRSGVLCTHCTTTGAGCPPVVLGGVLLLRPSESRDPRTVSQDKWGLMREDQREPSAGGQHRSAATLNFAFR